MLLQRPLLLNQNSSGSFKLRLTEQYVDRKVLLYLDLDSRGRVSKRKSSKHIQGSYTTEHLSKKENGWSPKYRQCVCYARVVWLLNGSVRICPVEIWEHLQLKSTLILRYARLRAHEPHDHEGMPFSSSKGHSAGMTTLSLKTRLLIMLSSSSAQKTCSPPKTVGNSGFRTASRRSDSGEGPTTAKAFLVRIQIATLGREKTNHVQMRVRASSDPSEDSIDTVFSGLIIETCSGIWVWIKWSDKVIMIGSTSMLIGMVLVGSTMGSAVPLSNADQLPHWTLVHNTTNLIRKIVPLGPAAPPMGRP
ncbi:hypothetical protein VNO77_22620 [Canavalia gladiata]|uniref:Uncharacterized protein n=1 Tax=Canavalia gladiata TaxID=3824 RepID=A0AAN9L4C4_CANGL